MGTGENDTAREQRGARRLFRMLAEDPEHGAANKEIVSSWLAEWTPRCLEAAHQIVNGRFDPREGEAGLKQLEEDHAQYGLKGVKLYTAEWKDGSRG